MAKKRTIPATDVKRDLEKTLKVDDITYNINAVHSDTSEQAKAADEAKSALKVEKKLTINSKVLDATTDEVKTETLEFDGEIAQSIDIVPASGGKFSGPVRVVDQDNLEDLNLETVVNYGDLSKILQKFTGAGWYNWEDNVFTIVTKQNKNQYLGVVVGEDKAFTNTKTGFAIKNYENGYLPLYLYIAKDTGNLYYGFNHKAAADRFEYSQLATNAFVLKSEKNNKNYTVESLTDEFSRLSSALNELDQKTAKNDDVKSLRTELNKITSGDTLVSKATKDSSGNIITNYYQKKIIISQYAPTTSDGVDGDIWIKY